MRATTQFLAVITIWACTSLLIGAFGFNGAFSDRAAAWVQAVGSVLAIAAIGWTLHADDKRERRRREEARLETAIIYFHVSNLVLEGMEKAFADIVGDKPAQFHAANFDGLRFALDELDLNTAPDGRFALALLNLRRYAKFFEDAYTAAVPLRNLGAALPHEHRSQLGKMLDATRETHAKVDEWVHALAGALESEFD